MFELFFTFFKIGLFTFGGGYAMIPLVQQEVVAHGWMDAETLIRYIAICESTPGPIAVNMATFVGSSQYGLLGSALATLGVVLPSFVIILLISAVLKGFQKNRYVNAALSGIRPVIAGLIVGTGVSVSVTCLFPGMTENWTMDWRSGLIGVILLAGMYVWQKLLKRKFSAIQLILFAAVLGVLVFGI